jgi:phosphatidylglycerophosphate synthase
VIQQAALYLASADDVQVARLRVGGRPLAFRVVVAAVRAGARRVVLPPALRCPDLEDALSRAPSARAAVVWLDSPGTLAAEPTLLLPAAALAPTPALAALLAAEPGRVLAASASADAPAVTVDAATLAEVRAALAEGAPVADVLARALKTHTPVPLGGDHWFVRVTGPRAAAEAEACLWQDLGSPIDTRLDVALHRRLSRRVTQAAVGLGIGPNPITVVSGAVGLAAAAAVSQGDVTMVAVGLGLYLLAVVLDHTDGEVARLTLSESPLGARLDIVLDTLVHATLALALGWATAGVTGRGWVTGLVGAVGVVASAIVGHRWPPPPLTAADRGLLDALTSRDGFYAMLLLFLLLRSLAPGLLPVLMAVVAVGTHAYWVARLVVSVRGRRKTFRKPK